MGLRPCQCARMDGLDPITPAAKTSLCWPHMLLPCRPVSSELDEGERGTMGSIGFG